MEDAPQETKSPKQRITKKHTEVKESKPKQKSKTERDAIKEGPKEKNGWKAPWEDLFLKMLKWDESRKHDLSKTGLYIWKHKVKPNWIYVGKSVDQKGIIRRNKNHVNNAFNPDWIHKEGELGKALVETGPDDWDFEIRIITTNTDVLKAEFNEIVTRKSLVPHGLNQELKALHWSWLVELEKTLLV